MYVIIVGCGRVGSQLAHMLSAEGHDIVVIDKNPKSFERLGSEFNGVTIEGVGFDPDTLKKAGIKKADALAALTNGDNSNIMAAQVAKNIFKVPYTVARLYDPERAHIYRRFGLETICSTTIGAVLVKNILIHRDTKHHCPLSEDTEVIEINVPDKLAGKKVSALCIEGKFFPAAIMRGKNVLISPLEAKFEKGDSLIAIAKTTHLDEIKKELGLKNSKGA